MSELTKHEKALSRELIEKGLQKECAHFLNKVRNKLNTADNQTPHKRYLDLYKMVYNFDKLIDFRYGRISGSHYLDIVSGLYVDGIISDNDIAGYQEGNRNFLLRMKHLVDSTCDRSSK